MPENVITPIEKKTHIAADAGQAIAAYLEETVSKLVRTGNDDAFAVTSQLEERIVELITAQNSDKKIGLDVVMTLIQEELGTPDEIVWQYSESRMMNNKSNIDKISKDATLLQKRQTRDVPTLENWWVLQIMGLIAVNLILILSSFTIYYEGFQMVAFIGYIAIVSSFIIIEYNASKRAVLSFKYWFALNLRYTKRGLVGMTVLVSFFVLETSNSSLIYKNNDTMEIFEMTSVIGFLLYEVMIYYRDHKIGCFPLEPRSRSSFRLFTIPYLFLISGFILFLITLLGADVGDLYSLVVVFGFLAATWAFITRSAVTPRFYILAYILQTFPAYDPGISDVVWLIIAFPLIILIIDSVRIVMKKSSIIKTIIDEVKTVVE